MNTDWQITFETIMGFLRTPEQFSKELNCLQKDIFQAKVHFDIFNGLRQVM